MNDCGDSVKLRFEETQAFQALTLFIYMPNQGNNTIQNQLNQSIGMV